MLRELSCYQVVNNTSGIERAFDVGKEPIFFPAKSSQSIIVASQNSVSEVASIILTTFWSRLGSEI
jgi:hypothetical protein